MLLVPSHFCTVSSCYPVKCKKKINNRATLNFPQNLFADALSLHNNIKISVYLLFDHAKALVWCL